jgi:hypothetical protein
LTFTISQAPYGGGILWTESREVEVVQGAFHVDLGEQVPIPMDVLTRANLFVGMRVGDGKEIFPRNQLVQVVYVSSHSPAILNVVPGHETAMSAALPKIDATPLQKTTWGEAAAQCSRMGKRLCRYGEWYSGYDRAEALQLKDLRGHYEWVQPWVYNWEHYEKLNPLFQGKEDGCEYWMIAPTNANPFRCCEGPSVSPVSLLH